MATKETAMKNMRNFTWPALAALLAAPAPSHAQSEDYETIVTIMRACAQIDDMVARVTCYDNNILPRGEVPVTRPANPARTVPTTPGRAAPAPEFGVENLPREREARKRAQVDEIERQVTAASESEPGIYLLTLNDGSRWRFTESMGLSYDSPQAGARVRIERGALGSYRLHYNDQRAVRVQRVR